MSVDPWEKAYVYGRVWGGGPRVAHIVMFRFPYGYPRPPVGLCLMEVEYLSPSAEPYRICAACLRTERAKELGL